VCWCGLIGLDWMGERGERDRIRWQLVNSLVNGSGNGDGSHQENNGLIH